MVATIPPGTSVFLTKKTKVPTRIIRRGGEEIRREFREGEQEIKIRGRFVPVREALRPLTPEEQRQAELGLLGQQFFRVTPEDIARFGSAEAAIEAQRAAGAGVTLRGFERGGRAIAQRGAAISLAAGRVRGGLMPSEIPTVGVRIPRPQVEQDIQFTREVSALSRSQGISRDEAISLIQTAEPAVLGTAGFAPPIGRSFATMSESERRASIAKAKIMQRQDSTRYNQFIRTRQAELRGAEPSPRLISVGGVGLGAFAGAGLPEAARRDIVLTDIQPRTVEEVPFIKPFPSPMGTVGGLGGLGVSAVELGSDIQGRFNRFFLGDVLGQKELASRVEVSRLKAKEQLQPIKAFFRPLAEMRAGADITFIPERPDLSIFEKAGAPPPSSAFFQQRIPTPEREAELRRTFIREEAVGLPKIPEITKQIGEITRAGGEFQIQKGLALSQLSGVEKQLMKQITQVETAPEDAMFTIREEGKADVVKSRVAARGFFEKQLAGIRTDIIELKARRPEITLMPTGFEKLPVFAKPFAKKLVLKGEPKEAVKFLERAEKTQREMQADIQAGQREYYFQGQSPEAYASRFINVAGDIATFMVAGGVVVGQLPRVTAVAREAGIFGAAGVGGKFAGFKVEEFTGIPIAGAAVDIGLTLGGGLALSRIARAKLARFDKPSVAVTDIKVEPEIRQFFFETKPTKLPIRRGVTLPKPTLLPRVEIIPKGRITPIREVKPKIDSKLLRKDYGEIPRGLREKAGIIRIDKISGEKLGFAGRFRVGRGTIEAKIKQEGIISHEVGHGITDSGKADMTRWSEIIRKEGVRKKTFRDYGVEGKTYFRRPREDFAESINEFVNNPSWLKKNFPLRYKHIKELSIRSKEVVPSRLEFKKVEPFGFPAIGRGVSLKTLDVTPDVTRGFAIARFDAVASVGTKRAGTIFTVSGKTLSKVGEESVVSISKIRATREFVGAIKPFGRLQQLRA